MQAKYLDAEHTQVVITKDNGDELYVPAIMGNRHYKKLIEDGVSISNYSQPVKAELQVKLKSQVKMEAQRRILELVPTWKQNNLTARMVELVNKKLVDTLTVEEEAEIAAVQAIWDQVKAIRTNSDELETLIDTALVADLRVLDVTDDARWD